MSCTKATKERLAMLLISVLDIVQGEIVSDEDVPLLSGSAMGALVMSRQIFLTNSSIGADRILHECQKQAQVT